MQNRTPRPGSSGPTSRECDARLNGVLVSVVTGARRRAVRDGDRQVDTAHLLHTLLESDPEVRAAFDGGPQQVARLLGYLVQRSIGYGLRWCATVEDSGTVPPEGTAPGLSPAALAAVHRALDGACSRGAECAEGLDLLSALAADPESRAVEVLHRAGVDPGPLAAGGETPGPAVRGYPG
ncbi:Clp protease N-terminal domain-containing protein [Streptomyces sp. NPDC004647]|uniref:Clp protease N-terminal domain-containing protein n=1 Tax=Streptomyces sp. NPDC004647 TaxID=3154671 RepID=UPI0033BDDFBE